MTEGNGHVIDPGGEAHRALQAAVAEHGPQVLSDAATMDGICRERLSAQPGEAALIGTAARSDVPALLQEQISRLGNYGGIQSVAGALADAHGLDRAESLWVVREYARALGLIASGGTRPTRRLSGSAGAAAAAGAEGDTVLSRAAEPRDEPGDTALSEIPWAAGGSGAGSPGETVLDKAASDEVPGSEDRPGDTILGGTADDQPGPNDTVISPVSSGQAPPADAPPVDELPAEEPPVEELPAEEPPVEEPRSATVLSAAAGGVAATAAAGTQAPGWESAPEPVRPAADGAGLAAGESAGGEPRETWEPVAGNAVFGGYQPDPPPSPPQARPASGGSGYPPGPPGGDGYPAPQPLPYATPRSNRNRNIAGIAAAIVLVAVYLGIAAAAHLTPFPAKTTAAASTAPPSQASGSSPNTSPTASATATPAPTQPVDMLLAKIPADIAGTNNCKNIGIASGATARLQCTGFQGPATGIIYYLYSDANALSAGFSSFLTSAKFAPSTKPCTTNGQFVNFVVQCEDTFSFQTPAAAGRIAEYQRVKDFDPIIASTDTPQLVMAVLVGTNDGDLLSYWKQFGWIKS